VLPKKHAAYGECPAGIQGAAEKGRFYNTFGIKFFYQFLKNRILNCDKYIDLPIKLE
jgi:hypothetical protein